MTTPHPMTPSVTISLTITQQDIEFLSWETTTWDADLAAQSITGRFIHHDRNEFVAAPIGSTVHFFFNYLEALVARAYFTGRGIGTILAIDSRDGDWAVIVP